MRADLTRSHGITDHGLEQDPEVDATFAGAGKPAGGGANGARVSVTDEVMRLERGNNPWSENPGHGSAMKQARKARGGANRRERAKRRGRNVDGTGMPVGEWTPRADVVMRE